MNEEMISFNYDDAYMLAISIDHLTDFYEKSLADKDYPYPEEIVINLIQRCEEISNVLWNFLL